MIVSMSSQQAGGSSRRDFRNTSSDLNRHDTHGRRSRDNSAHRRPIGRQPSPPPRNRSKDRMGPPKRPLADKFRPPAKGVGGGASSRSARDVAPARSNVRRAMSPTAKVTIQRRIISRLRREAHRVKMAKIRR